MRTVLISLQCTMLSVSILRRCAILKLWKSSNMPKAVFECCNKITNSYDTFDVTVKKHCMKWQLVIEITYLHLSLKVLHLVLLCKQSRDVTYIIVKIFCKHSHISYNIRVLEDLFRYSVRKTMEIRCSYDNTKTSKIFPKKH